MPTSFYSQLNEIVSLVVLTKPKSILDVGIGFGTYGFLAREYLELWDGRGEYGDWKVRIDGIEIFKKYITPLHDFIYDQIHIGDAIEILPTLKASYDLILMIDILEHFNYQNGIKLLEECKEHARNIILSTPKKNLPQENVFGNPFEAHKFYWTRKHFDMFNNKFFVSNPKSTICYIGDKASTLRKKLIVSKVGRRFPFFKRPYKVIKRVVRYIC